MGDAFIVLKKAVNLYLVVVLLLFTDFANSDPIFTISNSSTVTIDKHGTCRKITNNSGKALMVATATSAEWSSFVNNATITGVTKADCLNFDIGTGFNGKVNAIAVQTDGKILVGGNFTTYDGVAQNRLVRLNADGTKDTTFDVGTGFDAEVKAVAVQADGKILVGGYFSTYKGSTQNKLIRLDSVGAKDPTFDIGTGIPTYSWGFGNGGYVYTIKLQTDGKILVGGFFNNYNGTTVPDLIRIETNGNLDATFSASADIQFGFAEISDLEVQSDGKILAAGAGFTNNFIRLTSTGATDATFNLGSGFNDYTKTVELQADGKIIIGGAFTTYQGNTHNRIIRLDSTGSVDASFATTTGFNGLVSNIELQADGMMVVGGSYTTYQGNTENRIIRLEADGDPDATFDSGTAFNNQVDALAFQSDGKIVVGGNFTTFIGTAQNRIIRLKTDGSKD